MIIYFIFLIAGGLLLRGALVALRSRLTFVKNGERSVGTVVQIIESKDSEGTYYFPVFEINSRLHETVTYKPGTAYSTSWWKIGDTAAFIFEPSKPDTVRPLNYWRIFWWPLSLMAVAIDLLVIGAGYFLLYGYFGT